MDNLFTNSIFETDTWLNAIAKDKWTRIEIKKNNGDIEACFPIVKGRRCGFRILDLPPLTQTLGIYIPASDAKLSKRLEKEKKILNKIIEMIPKGYNCNFRLDIDNQYILPFIWKGFKVIPKYSYRIENLKDLDVIWNGFKENIKTDIRKAQKKVIIREDLSIDALIKMQTKSFSRQGRRMPIDIELIKSIDDILIECNARKLLCAVDEEGNIHAAAYFVFDKRRCYYLMGGGDPEFRNSGAASLLIWEGIKFAHNHSEIFDFEGSMIESIERFFRGFGAVPRVYYNVTKLNVILQFAEYLKPKVKKIIGYK